MILHIFNSIINLSLIMLLTSISVSSDSARRERHRDQILTETGSRNDLYHIKMLTWQLTTSRKRGGAVYSCHANHSLLAQALSNRLPLWDQEGVYNDQQVP